MRLVFHEFYDPMDSRHARICEALEGMQVVDRLYMVHRHACRIPPEDADTIVDRSFKIAQITAGLVRYYHSRGAVAFHYTKKPHDCLTAALASKYTNPMGGDCSSGEDFMKTAKLAIRGSMYGNGLKKCSNVAIGKYVKGLQLKAVRNWWKK